MNTSTRPKQTLVGIELVRQLAYEGDHIFTTNVHVNLHLVLV